MANKTFHSSTVTFLDRTDERKLEVYISSNHPTVQIKNQNTGEYTPDWSTTNLQLSADVYIDSQDVTTDSQTTINWYAKIGNTETLVGKGESLKISTNALDTNPIITYVCKAAYQNVSALSQVTFTRADTGLNGTNGTSAPAVQAQYSIDGTSSWTATLNASTHKYIRYSYDGGKTWTTAIKMVGEDGTSVNIKGTATSKTAVSGTSYFTLVYNSTTITGATMGDAYLLDGNMYVCVDSRDGNDYFMDVGRIQGPQGNDGQSSYVFIRYATDANGANMTASPTSATTHIGICTVSTNISPTTASSYTWSKFVGDNAKSIILTGSAQVFKVSKTNAYTPSTISVTATPINTTITEWTYSVNGGQTFLSTVPTGVVRNGNTVTITGSTLASNSLVIKASDGQYSDVFTIYKAFDGADGTPGNPGAPASMAFLTNENISFSANENGQVALTSFTTNVVAYSGTTKVTPTIGTITGLPAGMTVSAPTTTANELILTFSIANNSTLGAVTSTNGTITIPVTSPVSTNLILSWSKINTGAQGTPGSNGADAVTFQVYSSNGYALSINTPTVTLQTFAYIGDVAITAGATYQWYIYNDAGWSAISGGTNAYLTITREDVDFSNSYMCKMTFGGVEYTSVATIDDKNDENRVFTTKPSNYVAGDLWVVGVDYAPAGVAVGTLLRAEHTNVTYGDVDWVTATKYDKELSDLKDNIETYNQYFSFDSAEGLKISAKDNNGTPSQFSTSLTNERLSFNYGNEAVAYINGTKMNIKEAEIESPLTVTGKYSGSTMLQAPVINIGKFSIIVESNGSLSIVANT